MYVTHYFSVSATTQKMFLKLFTLLQHNKQQTQQSQRKQQTQQKKKPVSEAEFNGSGNLHRTCV